MANIFEGFDFSFADSASERTRIQLRDPFSQFVGSLGSSFGLLGGPEGRMVRTLLHTMRSKSGFQAPNLP